MSIQQVQPYDVAEFDREIQQILAQFKANEDQSDKLYAISEYFLGCPYVLNALGEGPTGQFDQYPLYRHDIFDCVTYMNTVIALTMADNFAQFKSLMLRLNYYDQNPQYHKRFHFLSADWNPTLQQMNLLEDITQKITDENAYPIALSASTVIDRPNWIRFHRLEQIKLLQSLPPKKQEQRLRELHQLAKQLNAERVEMFYLPFSALFDKSAKPNHFLFKQIPNGSVIEIVRPNWDLKHKIGTNMHISHVGFVFWINEELQFRQASQLDDFVNDVPLIDYLKKYLDSPTIRGINVQSISETVLYTPNS